jgi:hypothetical protein
LSVGAPYQSPSPVVGGGGSGPSHAAPAGAAPAAGPSVASPGSAPGTLGTASQGIAATQNPTGRTVNGTASGTPAGNGGGAAISGTGAIQNGSDAQPAQAAITRQERAAGVALPPAQNQRETASVEQQVNHLIQKSQTETRDLPGSMEPH